MLHIYRVLITIQHFLLLQRGEEEFGLDLTEDITNNIPVHNVRAKVKL